MVYGMHPAVLQALTPSNQYDVAINTDDATNSNSTSFDGGGHPPGEKAASNPCELDARQTSAIMRYVWLADDMPRCPCRRVRDVAITATTCDSTNREYVNDPPHLNMSQALAPASFHPRA